MDFVTGEILYIDKPLEWTSFDVVKRLRGVLLHRLHRKKFKVGHAGTVGMFGKSCCDLWFR